MIKIAIVEDEQEVQKIIEKNIQRSLESMEVVKLSDFVCGEDFLEYMEQGGKADILFLDIELPGMNGIALGRKLREEYPAVKIVFLTAYSEFAAESYEIEADQYIVKADMGERLPDIVRKLCARIQKEREEYRWIGNQKEREKIYYCDILYVQKVKGTKYVEFVTTKGRYRERINMEVLIEEIKGDEFVLAERGCLINLRHVAKVAGNAIGMDNEDEVVIGRTRIGMVKEQIRQYWRNR